ncbi:MAG: retropepsin-like domain-containing protein [Proteobacteria bacterium]|nr:retropepsin-like domain-containing protein [Pseudomonadota bacterium]
MKATLLAASVMMLAAASPSVAEEAPNAVRIQIYDSHVYVAVTLPSSRPLWFLVDSGAAAPVNLIDSGVAKQIGLKLNEHKKVGAIGGSVQITMTESASLQLGSLKMDSAPLAAIALESGEKQEGHAVDGILGYAFFAAYNPEIDYTARRMVLRKTPVLQGSDFIPLRIVHKNCQIEALLTIAKGRPAISVKLTIDTGFDGGLILTSPFVARHNLLAAGVKVKAGSSLGGMTSSELLRGTKLVIGKQELAGLDAKLSIDKDGAFAATDVDGYIGGEILRHYKVLFDYRNGRLVLTPNDRS